MGFIANLLSFARKGKISESKVDPGGGYNQTARHFSVPGDDSVPLPNDIVALIETPRNGIIEAVGYIDPNNQQKTQAGGKRIYARDPETGQQIAEVWIMNDGTISGSNANGSFTLDLTGDFVVNGVVIDTDGNITAIDADDSLTIDGGELNGHTHISASPGSPSGPFPP